MSDAKTTKSGADSIGKIAICWRILHLITNSYGSSPTGQIVTALTIKILHRNDYSPTVTEICKATGIPNTSVTRYVAWQIRQGYLMETIDPNDRRVRRLDLTEKGRRWLDSDIVEVWRDVDTILERVDEERNGDPKQILQRMAELTHAAERRFLT